MYGYNQEMKDVCIYNELGAIVYQTNTTTSKLHISNLSTGMYIIAVQQQGGIRDVQKVVVE